MVTEISSERILLDLLRPIVLETRAHAERCRAFNDLPSIPWRQREGVRAVEGKLDGLDQFVLEFVDARRSVNSPMVEAFVDELWPDDGVA